MSQNISKSVPEPARQAVKTPSKLPHRLSLPTKKHFHDFLHLLKSNLERFWIRNNTIDLDLIMSKKKLQYNLKNITFFFG